MFTLFPGVWVHELEMGIAGASSVRLMLALEMFATRLYLYRTS